MPSSQALPSCFTRLRFVCSTDLQALWEQGLDGIILEPKAQLRSVFLLLLPLVPLSTALKQNNLANSLGPATGPLTIVET